MDHAAHKHIPLLQRSILVSGTREGKSSGQKLIRVKDVLLTEGNTVLVSEMVMSRKFNLCCYLVGGMRGFSPAKKECRKTREEATGNNNRLPDQSCREHEMRCCPKRGQ